jgi:CheY-like chemotaxis protein
MLLNLALNARDAMLQGGTLSITARSQSLAPEEATKRQVQPGAYVVLAVRDTGVGMDAATLLRIFEPFFTTKEAGMGTGLGLCMVFGAMKQCGGFVEASSELGRGSCFQLWFPRVPPPLEPAADRAGGSERALHVLLVEDSEPVLKLATAMLNSAGHRVRVAASGAEALARWSEEPADVLVTDVVMPQMSGVTLAQDLRRQVPSLPVLFITGYLPDRVGLAAQSAHSAVVMKPFQRRELLAALDALVTESSRLLPEKSAGP